MSTYVGENKEQLSANTIQQLKDYVTKDAWIALRQYFCGRGNASEAKVACVVITTIAREQQAKNNARQLDLLEKRLALEGPKIPTVGALPIEQPKRKRVAQQVIS